MKALIVLNLEDCTFDEIEEAEIKEINLVYQDKETGNRYEFEWETGFKIIPMPQKKTVDHVKMVTEAAWWEEGYNQCIDEILGGKK